MDNKLSKAHRAPLRLLRGDIQETKNLSADADSRTDTIFKRLHDLSKKEKEIKKLGS